MGIHKRIAAGIGCLMLLSSLPCLSAAAAPSAHKKESLAKLTVVQLPFVENIGQLAEPKVRFSANTFAGSVFVTEAGEIVYTIVRKVSNGSAPTIKAVALKESPGLPTTARLGGQTPSSAKANYFLGKKETWKTGVPMWQEVTFGEIRNGIELKLKAYGDNVEKLFTVKPNAAVGDIRMVVEGARGLLVNVAGELEIATELGVVKMTRPLAYQERDGKRVAVEAKYSVTDSGGRVSDLPVVAPGPQFAYGFTVGNYDQTRPLVIDPLLASTFIGGDASLYTAAANELSYGIGLDADGNVFIAGETWSTNYPTTPGVYDPTYNAWNGDVFVSKFSGDLGTLIASTYLGGDGTDHATALAIGSSGNVYVYGQTGSANYPVTSGSYDLVANGGHDLFVSKLDGSLGSLLASTYVGGSSNDSAIPGDMALDATGNVYLTGYTASSDYPTTDGAFDASFDYTDAVVSKLDGDLTTLFASTLLGGGYNDYGHGIAVDASGNVFVAGLTTSDDFPTTAGAFDQTKNGPLYTGTWDGFVSKFNGTLTTLAASTFIGGSSAVNYVRAIISDASGNVYVTGPTNSDDFPTTPGAFDRNINGWTDVFVAKLPNDLSSLTASTYLGGSSDELAYDLAVDQDGAVYVAGETKSTDFSTQPWSYDSTHNGGDAGSEYDAFITQLSGDFSSVLTSTFLGGNQRDHAHALTLDGKGSVYVTGGTQSANYPATTGAYDESLNADWDTFVSKFDMNLCVTDNVPVTVVTEPAGLQLLVDGLPASPAPYAWCPGSSHTLEAPSPQSSDGTEYSFASWSDGGARVRALTAPSSTATYTAAFDSLHPPTIETLTPSVLNTKPDETQILSAVYSDPNGYQDIKQVMLLVNATQNYASAILIKYDKVADKLYLKNDANNNWGAGVTPGPGMATLSNSQGTIDSCSLSGSGNTLTLNVTITPTAAFATGKKNVYMNVTDMADATTGMVDKGDWTIQDQVAPTAGTVTPAAGTSAPGTARSFTVVYSDGNGYEDIRTAMLLVNANMNYPNAILLKYDRVANKLYLKNDANNNWGTGVTPGAGMVALSNSQGTVDSCTVAGSGSNLTLTLTITPKVAFASSTKKNIYLSATDLSAATSGLVDKGDWTIFANVVPAAVSVTPATAASAPGTAQLFTAVYSDANGYADLTQVKLLVNTTKGLVNALFINYDRVSDKLYLKNDANTGWGAGVTPGPGMATLSNSQGTIDGCTVTVSGNELTLDITITPKAAFASTKKKNLYLYANDKSNAVTGWVDQGDWTIN